MESISSSLSPARSGAVSDPARAPVPSPSTTGQTPNVSTDTASPRSQQTISDGNKNNNRNNNSNNNSSNNNNRNYTRGNSNSNNNSNKRRRRARQNQHHHHHHHQHQQQNKEEATQPLVCSVCEIVKDDGPPKYKCPKCRATYCSVACCREHKTVCPGTTNGRAAESVGSTQPTAAESTTAKSAASSETTVAPAANPALDPFKNPCDDDDNDNDDNEDSSDCDDDDDSSLEDGWKITDDMRVALRNSIWLRNELRDGGLRDMIASVVKSEKMYKSYHKRQKRQRTQQFHRHGHGHRHRHHHHKGHHRFQSKQSQPPHPHDALTEKRSEHRNFDVFADKLLVLADVLERQEPSATDDTTSSSSSSMQLQLQLGIGIGRDGRHSNAGSGRAPNHRNEEELEEWLHRKWDPSMPPPALALKSMKKVIPNFQPVDVSSSSEDEHENENEDASMNGHEPERS